MNTKENPAEDKFTVDLGDGKGYEVYYRKRNGCWWYTVTYNDNGCRNYSRTRRLPREMYEQIKEKHNEPQ